MDPAMIVEFCDVPVGTCTDETAGVGFVIAPLLGNTEQVLLPRLLFPIFLGAVRYVLDFRCKSKFEETGLVAPRDA